MVCGAVAMQKPTAKLTLMQVRAIDLPQETRVCVAVTRPQGGRLDHSNCGMHQCRWAVTEGRYLRKKLSGASPLP